MFYREYHTYFMSTAEYLIFLMSAYGIHEKTLNFLFITFFWLILASFRLGIIDSLSRHCTFWLFALNELQKVVLFLTNFPY